MGKGQKSAVIVAILFITVFTDQWTKQLAEALIKDQPVRYFLGELFQLRWAVNYGAFGGLGSSLPEPFRQWVLTVLPSLVLGLLTIYVLFSNKLKTYEVIGFAFIIGGGIGNLIDRIVTGFVIDFMYMSIGPIGTNIFNLADVYIVIGTIIFIIYGLQNAKANKKATNKSTTSSEILNTK